MRFDAALFLSLVLLAACDEKPQGPAPSRFASVKKNTQAAATAFCDKSYAAKARPYLPAEQRPFGPAAEKTKGWTWVNLWATWCKPCVEEMGVLNQWHDAMARDGLKVDFELLSIDETAAQPALEAWSRKNLPGPIRWLRSDEDLGPFLDGLGVERTAPIPIHVLIDPARSVRCVRVGAIHEQNYGSVRDLIAGG